jgi:hypothetical protein
VGSFPLLPVLKKKKAHKDADAGDLQMTSHPPGGASALLAATNKQIFQLGWFCECHRSHCINAQTPDGSMRHLRCTDVGYIMIGSCLMLGWGMIINNIGRR